MTPSKKTSNKRSGDHSDSSSSDLFEGYFSNVSDAIWSFGKTYSPIPSTHFFLSSKKVKYSDFEIPASMNPRVILKNIWDDLQNGGLVKNLLPNGIAECKSELRYETKTISLFDDSS